MRIELLVNYPEFWSRLADDLRSAGKSAFVQTFALEGDPIGKQLAEALRSSPAIDKRILADTFTQFVLSDRFRFSPANLLDRSLRHERNETTKMVARLRDTGVAIRYTNPLGASPRKLLSRNHKKLVLIDERIAYLGGINFSEHNASWHDMMLRVEDRDVAAFMSADFLSTWDRRDSNARAEFPELELLTADGRNNRAAFQRVLDLIDRAEQTIFVESPYISFPFYERLRAATARGVTVKIVTPEQNNWKLFTKYAGLEAARSEIDLYLCKGMSHLKAMLIDDQYLIAGSSNFDYLSYRIHQELLAVITAPEVIADFRRRVMTPDLSQARAVECRASTFSKRWLSWRIKLLDAALEVLT
jgi:cardiolipin synthase A/B